jgi:predicted dehydrogenase
VHSGETGEILHVRARRASFGRLRFVEDVWWSFAPHDLSIVLAVMGEEPIDGRIARHSYATPGIADFAYGDFRFSRDRSAHVEATWLDPNKAASLDVFGSKQTLSLRDRSGKAQLKIFSCGIKRGDSETAELWRGDETTLEFTGDEPLRTELESFIGMISRGETVPSDADAGVGVVRALSMTPTTPKTVHELYERMPA